MRRIAVLACLAFLLGAVPASAERLTVGLSSPDVRINSNFTGVPITVFGAIERDANTISRAGGYDVAIMVTGPSESVAVRRKDRILGIWANAASETFFAVPSFYAVASSGGIDTLAGKPVLSRLDLGFDNIGFVPLENMNDSTTEEFRHAFVRLKQQIGLYAENPESVDFLGDTVFRTTIWVPANVAVGPYKVRAFLFSDGALLARQEEQFRILKTGFEQWVFTFSREQSFIYGVLCVVLALFTGWLAGVIFRRD